VDFGRDDSRPHRIHANALGGDFFERPIVKAVDGCFRSRVIDVFARLSRAEPRPTKRSRCCRPSRRASVDIRRTACAAQRIAADDVRPEHAQEPLLCMASTGGLRVHDATRY
jgi:hypothetical protein